MKKLFSAAIVASFLLPVAAAAQITVGLIASTTGPASAVAQDQNDGFLLGVEQLNGLLGGQKAQIIREDDHMRPEIGIGVVQKLIDPNRNFKKPHLCGN